MSGAVSNDSGDNFVTDHDGGDDGYEEYTPPADRFLTAQIWWIASELVRRHPHLRISGHEVAGEGRLVLLHDEQDSMSIQWDLVGGCKYLVNGVVTSISWIEMMAAVSPHETVKRIEVGAGLGIPKAVPVTTPHSLSYRVIASALATAVDDRHEWCAVPAPMNPYDDPDCPYFQGFPSAIAARDEYAREADAQIASTGRPVHFFQPFWALLRNLEPIAIFDSAGVIHTVMGATELMPCYDSIHRKLALTTARVLGPYLP
ncbi:hypothetical protein D6T64_08365 [Cryobacterium melibiosiphilum]|uniref:T3SS peptide-binding chaperone domain-containing protein n=1 Tax=Cryobacterium melibiosiphilum TaxID=995039 RepID=A0A3A5MMA3_9MICO|nr:hypothetical protein [Cryobacterium melibiosiphilum]RJT88969.1 hypothetical protein D6T64_08365 [Cryobacterium melibiosiphilum]